MERKASLLEAAVIGGAILLSTSPEATPLRAAEVTPSKNTIHLVTPLPETYGKPTDMTTAVNSPEFQTNENPGFILLNTYNQNDPTAQERLISDLAIQKTWITSFGIPAEAFEQSTINMPLVSEQANYSVPVNRLVTEYNGAKAGSLLIPYSQADGQSKVAIFEDEDGAGDDTLIDVLGLVPNENSSLTEPKALPTLLKKSADGTYVAIRVFEVPMIDNSSQSEVPTVVGTPVYQAQVITDSLNLRDPFNPTVVMSQVARNENIMLISDRTITVPGKNYVLREALVDGQIALVAENLLDIKPAVGSAEYNDPMNLYESYVKSTELLTQREGIGVKSVDIVAVPLLPDVPVRPIIFVQSTDLENQSPQFRSKTMKLNFVDNLIPLKTEEDPKRPNFSLDGVDMSLNSFQAIEASVSQSLLHLAIGNSLVPPETTLEDFLRNYQDLEIPVIGRSGEAFNVKADAPVVFRFRGFESTALKKGLVRTNFGSYERSLGPDGELVVDMYYTSEKATKAAMNFEQEDNWESDEWNSGHLFNNAVFALGASGHYADFRALFGQYYYPAKLSPVTVDLIEVYSPQIQVYMDYAMNHWKETPQDQILDLYTNKYQLFSFQ